MSPRSLHALVVGPTTLCNVITVSGLNDWRKALGGNLSSLLLPETLRARGYAAYCNDDGVALELEPNRFAAKLGFWRLLGPAVIFRDHGDGDEHGLTANDLKFLARYLSGPVSLEAQAMVEADRRFLESNPSGVVMVAFETLDELLWAMGVRPSPPADAGNSV